MSLTSRRKRFKVARRTRAVPSSFLARELSIGGKSQIREADPDASGRYSRSVVRLFGKCLRNERIVWADAVRTEGNAPQACRLPYELVLANGEEPGPRAMCDLLSPQISLGYAANSHDRRRHRQSEIEGRVKKRAGIRREHAPALPPGRLIKPSRGCRPGPAARSRGDGSLSFSRGFAPRNGWRVRINKRLYRACGQPKPGQSCWAKWRKSGRRNLPFTSPAETCRCGDGLSIAVEPDDE